MAERYSISPARVSEIAQAGDLDPEAIHRICTADWSMGTHHQQWLDTASAAEVAEWVTSVLRNTY